MVAAVGSRCSCFSTDFLQVLVVNEEWGSATHSSLRSPEKSGSNKKVSLGDDTDAKSAGDEPRPFAG